MGPASDVKIGIDDITSGIKVRNVTEISEGIRSLGQFFEDVSPALDSKCKVAKQDALAIITVLKGFHSLEDVISHIKTDFAGGDQAKIAREFELMVSTYEQKKYSDFGNHAGRFLHRLVVGKYSDDMALGSQNLVVV